MDAVQAFWLALVNGQLVTDLGVFSYLLIALLAALEGPGITLAAGAMAGSGLLNPFAVLVAAGLGNFTADACWYLLGYLGQFDNLKRKIPALQKFDAQITAVEEQVKAQAVKLLIATKLSFGVAVIPILIAAGAARVTWRKLLPISLISELVWTGSLVLAGYFLGDYLAQLQLGLRLSLLVFGGLFFLVVTLFVVRWVRSKWKRDRQLEAELKSNA